MLVEELRTVFDDWKAQDLSGRCIEFKENYNPAFDPNDDYRVIYEVSFEPRTLDKARIEFWITDTGHVAVGIETYERIVQRLGLRAIRRGFAVGHEPSTVTQNGLMTLFNAVARGKIFIAATSVLKLAVSAKIYMAAADCNAIERSGYRCSNWISSISDEDAAGPSSVVGKYLNYRPW